MAWDGVTSDIGVCCQCCGTATCCVAAVFDVPKFCRVALYLLFCSNFTNLLNYRSIPSNSIFKIGTKTRPISSDSRYPRMLKNTLWVSPTFPLKRQHAVQRVCVPNLAMQRHAMTCQCRIRGLSLGYAGIYWRHSRSFRITMLLINAWAWLWTSCSLVGDSDEEYLVTKTGMKWSKKCGFESTCDLLDNCSSDNCQKNCIGSFENLDNLLKNAVWTTFATSSAAGVRNCWEYGAIYLPMQKISDTFSLHVLSKD